MHNVKSAICQYFPHSADYNSRLWEDDISMQRQVQGSDWGLGDHEIRHILAGWKVWGQTGVGMVKTRPKKCFFLMVT